MKKSSILTLLLAAGCIAGCESESAKTDQLRADAKITEDSAKATALAQVPNGVVKESELEKEHGKLIWSFDIAAPDAKGITEVNVDAIEGGIVSVEHEKD